MGPEYGGMVVVNGDFAGANRGHGTLQKLMQVRFFSVWWEMGGIQLGKPEIADFKDFWL